MYKNEIIKHIFLEIKKLFFDEAKKISSVIK